MSIRWMLLPLAVRVSAAVTHSPDALPIEAREASKLLEEI